MDVFLQIDDEFADTIDAAQIELAAQSTIRFIKNDDQITESSVTVTITTAYAVRQLNHQYRDIDGFTDVLSFENVPDPDFPATDASMSGFLGDVVIAFPVAKSQALAGGHTVTEEIMLLTVHGTLHLLKFDHDTPESKSNMWAIQRQIMDGLGLGYIQPTEK